MLPQISSVNPPKEAPVFISLDEKQGCIETHSLGQPSELESGGAAGIRIQECAPEPGHHPALTKTELLGATALWVSEQEHSRGTSDITWEGVDLN